MCAQTHVHAHPDRGATAQRPPPRHCTPATRPTASRVHADASERDWRRRTHGCRTLEVGPPGRSPPARPSLGARAWPPPSRTPAPCPRARPLRPCTHCRPGCGCGCGCGPGPVWPRRCRRRGAAEAAAGRSGRALVLETPLLPPEAPSFRVFNPSSTALPRCSPGLRLGSPQPPLPEAAQPPNPARPGGEWQRSPRGVAAGSGPESL